MLLLEKYYQNCPASVLAALSVNGLSINTKIISRGIVGLGSNQHFTFKHLIENALIDEI